MLHQIDALLARAELDPGDLPGWRHFENLNEGQRMGLTTAWSAAIERLTTQGSQYRELLQETLDRYTSNDPTTLAHVVGILNALREDIEAGFTASVAELIHAEVSGDFIEMTAELLEKGYKDAAAVLCGSVLEEHLRQLAAKHGIAVEDEAGRARKADVLNADLTKAGGYSKLEQKAVTAWLGIRNEAAHGHFDAYTLEQVVQMLDGVRSFLIRHPA